MANIFCCRLFDYSWKRSILNGWNCKLSANFNTGEGAFRNGKDFRKSMDAFGFGARD